MEPKMSRHWITGFAIASCVSLLAFTPIVQQGAPKAPPGAPAAGPQAGMWVVSLETSKWDAAKTPQEQAGFPEHMKHVQQMAADGTLLVGGPLLEGNEAAFKVTGALMIVKAESADAAKKLVSADSFVSSDVMKIASVRAFYAGAGQWVSAAAGAPHAPNAPNAPAAPAGGKH
jgi:uncharacterized protein YciI